MRRVYIFIVLFSIIALSIIGFYIPQMMRFSGESTNDSMDSAPFPYPSNIIFGAFIGTIVLGISLQTFWPEKTRSVSLDSTRSPSVLIVSAVVLLAIVLINNQSDIVNATLLLGGISCFVGGIILLAFSREGEVDSRLAGVLPVQGALNTCELFSNLSVNGNAHFIPTKKGIMQLNLEEDGVMLPSPPVKYLPGYHHSEEGTMMVTTPAAAPLIAMLEEENRLVVPREEDMIFQAIKEIMENVLELGEHLEIHRSEATIMADLYGYHLFTGCALVQKKTPRCCIRSPCPICSLFACILSTGLQKRIALEEIRLGEPDQSIHLKFLIE